MRLKRPQSKFSRRIRASKVTFSRQRSFFGPVETLLYWWKGSCLYPGSISVFKHINKKVEEMICINWGFLQSQLFGCLFDVKNKANLYGIKAKKSIFMPFFSSIQNLSWKLTIAFCKSCNKLYSVSGWHGILIFKFVFLFI